MAQKVPFACLLLHAGAAATVGGVRRRPPVRACKKPVCNERFLFSSRACLGKMIIIHYKPKQGQNAPGRFPTCPERRIHRRRTEALTCRAVIGQPSAIAHLRRKTPSFLNTCPMFVPSLSW
jgi:hypothetical protein